MSIDKILHVATFAGQIILENGGETYRVEETICRICHAYGVHYADSFVTPTGIMVSISDENHYTSTLIKRVKSRTVDLQKIHLVNDLSRSLMVNNLTVDEVYESLVEINRTTRYNNRITILFSALCAAGFAAMFGANFTDCIVSFFVGIAIKIFTLKADALNINSFFINSIGGAIASFLALIFYHFNIGTNIDTIIIGSIMLLVPGLAITNAIRDTIAGDLVSGLTRAAEAFLTAVAIAVGTGIVLSLWISYMGGI
ncbi:threonine/serine exporter family protein [Clostridium tarantellae]|uniref:Threonine/serine exporter n=1 Tax=Clostridium tarantellae TaxID=39493 RepID=A0A6I1MKK5_9CLOT|nr:threonine/serine exporter family protein [Clostridium tarantellae]MPQ42978.1 threonine/serine exporter [Clostridium tarantellae]